MGRSRVLQCLVVLLVAVFVRQASAREVIFDLGAPIFVGNTAQMTLGMEFIEGNGPSEGVWFWQLDTENSSVSLTGPAGSKDYSVLSFSPASPLLDLWFETPFADPTDDVSLLTYDDDFGAGTMLPPGVHVLGTLIADLSGIAAGTSVTVAIDGVDTDAAYLDSNLGGDFIPISYVNASRTFEVPTSSIIIPLPAAPLMALPLFAGVVLYGIRRRRDA